jgi:hypothetical protein
MAFDVDALVRAELRKLNAPADEADEMYVRQDVAYRIGFEVGRLFAGRCAMTPVSPAPG